MLSKLHVYEFIDNAQRAAIKKIEKEFEGKIDNAIDNYLKLPENSELAEAIKTFEEHHAITLSAQKTINNNTGMCQSYIASSVNLRYDIFKSYRMAPCEQVRVLKADLRLMTQKIKDEYDKVRAIVKRKRNGEQGKDALIALGFDVSELEKLNNYPVLLKPAEIEVDKALLFVGKNAG